MDLFNAGFSPVPFVSSTASSVAPLLISIVVSFWFVSLYLKTGKLQLMSQHLSEGKVVVLDGVGSMLSAIEQMKYRHVAIVLNKTRPSLPTRSADVYRVAYIPSISCPPGDASSTAQEANMLAHVSVPQSAKGTCIAAFGVPQSAVQAVLQSSVESSPSSVPAAAAAAAGGGSGGLAEQRAQRTQWPEAVANCLSAAHSTATIQLSSTTEEKQRYTLTATLREIAEACGVPPGVESAQATLAQLHAQPPASAAVIFYAEDAPSPDGVQPVFVFVLGMVGDAPPVFGASNPGDTASSGGPASNGGPEGSIQAAPEGTGSSPWTMRFKEQAYVLLPDGAVQLESVFGLEGAETECNVCLTEPKQVLLLPCRHMCVCTTCFAQIERCPVCRSSFEEHLVVRGLPEAAVADEPSPGESTPTAAAADMDGQEFADVAAVADAMSGERLAGSSAHRKAQVQ